MTVTLLIAGENGDGLFAGARYGGLPSVPDPSTFEWPCCKKCGGEMQFVLQLPAGNHDGFYLVFMCRNNPGMCEEWDANSGGNAVIVVSGTALSPANMPSNPKAVLNGSCAFYPENRDIPNYETAIIDAPVAGVTGQLGGVPYWLQHPEPPCCIHCDKEMRFVAQFEEGPDYTLGVNFGGGGAGYLFSCDCAPVSAVFLWQC